jgi:hypothetical protein
MHCPDCGAATEVNEKRGPFRDRRCTNQSCRFEFTTCESVIPNRNRGRLCARTRAAKIAAAKTPANEQPQSSPPRAGPAPTNAKEPASAIHPRTMQS